MISGCRFKVTGDRFLCQNHWHNFPGVLKKECGMFYAKYKDEEITHTQMFDAFRECVDEAEGLTARGTAVPKVFVSACSDCSQVVYRTTEGRRSNLVEAENGHIAIVGGRAQVVAPLERAGYTRFVAHACKGATVAGPQGDAT